MRVDQIKRLVELVEKSDIGELEIREWGRSIRIAKMGQTSRETSKESVPPPVDVSPAPSARPPKDAEAAVAAGVVSGSPGESDEGLESIVSPMVGTFYQASSQTASPYVEVGGRVKKGQIVCIIEAMKLMNEIEAEISGRIVKMLVKNEQPVEFNQPLYLVKPD